MGVTSHVMDFETASAADLKVVGAWAYAEHPTTEVLCLSFEPLNPSMTGAALTWYPPPALDAPMEDWNRWREVNGELHALLKDESAMFVSHGDFERAIWHHIMVPVFGFPPIPNKRWNDTMAIAAQKQLPLELDMLGRALGLRHEKDKEGRALTISLSKPNKKTGMLDRRPETLARVYQYCESDIGEEREALDRLGWLQPGERRVWLLDQKINQRGIKIDRRYVLACQKIVDEATVPLAKEFEEITGGLAFTQRDRIMGWLEKEGVHLPDLTKATIAGVLGGTVDDSDDVAEDDGSETWEITLPEHVKRALQIRQLVGSAAIKKLDRMAVCTNSDGRARGLLQYHGAGPGRWAGRILQPQNFPRPTDAVRGKSVDLIVGTLMTGDWEYTEMILGPAVEAVAGGLRHALIAEKGHTFVSGDFSTIEARIVLALAGQKDKIELFRRADSGERLPNGLKIDAYNDMGALIYGDPTFDRKKPEWQEQGQIAKNTVLGCGFGMGHAKFHSRYCAHQPVEFAKDVIDTYRNDWAPTVPDLWKGLEAAALRTVQTRQPHEAYGVTYALEGGWMTARLPSTRKLYYWNPQLVKRLMPWQDRNGADVWRECWTYQARKMGQIKTIDAYGGLLTENVVQGLARDLLVAAMFRLEENGFPLVLTVHDEAVAEPMGSSVDEKAFREIMIEGTAWSREIGLPVNSETWVGDRYRK